MNILVLNGSPKGKYSVTLQTILYWRSKYNENNFKVVNVAQKIKNYEKNLENFKSEITKDIEKADIIIFNYPVYTFLAPYQLHRFIELLKEVGIDFKGKFVTQFSTSKHFYDVTAHKFIEENIHDLKGKYINGLSADMEDLLEEKGRIEADCFFKKMIFDVENNICLEKKAKPRRKKINIYEDKIINITGNSQSSEKEIDQDVVIITNIGEDDKDISLQNMINKFVDICKYKVKIINIREFPFVNGCIGCLNCSTTAKCIYNDNFDEFLRDEIQSADGIIYAFRIENHYTHSSFKCYDDRQFCNGHRSVTHGMPVGYIISGNYSEEYNLQTIVNARSEVGGVYLCGVVTDENDTEIRMRNLWKTFDYALNNKIKKPANFYGVGGSKIFRDLVYLMQGMMKLDHEYYKENGIYDFPHNQKTKMMQMKVIGSLINNPKMKAKMGNMNKYIVAPYTKIIFEAKKDKE